MAPTRFQQHECAHHVRVKERRRIPQRVVIVGLCGKVHHGIRLGHELIDDPLIRHIPHHHSGLNPIQVRAVTRVGELV